ncbi:MAG: HlyD family type I secretion periplasmic adaptor subunit [Deltaproteobacteria bacterium]|nr:HlyD family type I secretion periplasmic adaptor subunit [Deltaproteobacteria bacterium]MBW2069274.1 HlyD family type I secretion periplasmic adaptor subunit [Deltaproteobacteria bacterium]
MKLKVLEKIRNIFGKRGTHDYVGMVSDENYDLPNPGKIIRTGVIVIAVFFGGIGGWAAFAPFSGAVIAPGEVKVAGEKKVIQHPEGGIVEKIYVKEGDHVKAGDVLIKLKDERVVAMVSMLQVQLWSKLAEAARLTAESIFAETIEWPQELKENWENPSVTELVQTEKKIFFSRRRDLLNKLSLIDSQIAQIEKQIEGYKQELKAQEIVVATLREELDAKQRLYDKQYVDKVTILNLKRALADRKGRIASLETSIAAAKQEIEGLKLQQVTIRNTYKEESLRRLGDVKDEIFSLRDRLRPYLDALHRLEIRAPVDGEVINLRVHSETSGVIRPGEPIMEIIPLHENLIVEAHIMVNDIAKVHPGQEAMVQITAFDRRSVPPVPGKVVYVSGDRITAQYGTLIHSYFVGRIVLDEDFLKEKNLTLMPGMATVCYITTEKRTVLEYLLEPILKVTDRAMRES